MVIMKKRPDFAYWLVYWNTLYYQHSTRLFRRIWRYPTTKLMKLLQVLIQVCKSILRSTKKSPFDALSFVICEIWCCWVVSVCLLHTQHNDTTIHAFINITYKHAYFGGFCDAYMYMCKGREVERNWIHEPCYGCSWLNLQPLLFAFLTLQKYLSKRNCIHAESTSCVSDWVLHSNSAVLTIDA